MITTTCETCGISFDVYPSELAKGKRHCCSWLCHVEKQNNPKVVCICKTCGELFERVPSKATNGRGQYCSKVCHGLSVRGENSPHWKDLKRVVQWERCQAEYKEWRKAVYARDDWTCHECGKRGGKLHVHHVFSFADFPEHRLEVWNGVTLCYDCHAAIHPILRRTKVENDF